MVLPHPGHRPGVPTVVELAGVTKRHQVGAVTVTALEDADLEVDQRELVVVLRPSGSGKTTGRGLVAASLTPAIRDSEPMEGAATCRHSS